MENKINELKNELREINERREVFRNEGNVEGEAQEHLRYTYLIEKLAELGVDEDFSVLLNPKLIM